jgi:hypothetical protein
LQAQQVFQWMMSALLPLLNLRAKGETNPKIAYDTITTNKIKDGEVNTDDIVDSAVVGN